MSKTSKLLFVAATIVLVPVELWCVESSLETQGEVMQSLVTLLVGLNIICAAAFWWLPRAALAGLLLLFALIVNIKTSPGGSMQLRISLRGFALIIGEAYSAFR